MLIITGVMHSGTSLIASILNAHPRIDLMFEEKRMITLSKQFLWQQKQSEIKGNILTNKVLYQVFPGDSLEEALDLFPNSKILFIWRDPRDVALSSLDRGSQGFQWSCYWWNKIICYSRELLETRGSELIHIIKYEDLIANPEVVLTKVCSFIGIPYRANMLNFQMLHPNFKEIYGHKVVSTNAYKWKQDERKDLIADIERRCEHVLEVADYEASSSSRR